jgi:hypothetical protein
MLDFINPKIIAGIEILTAASTVYFWIKWFRTEHKEPWLPEGYIEHERCFVYPDMLMSFLLFTAAALLFRGHSLGGRLSLVCGGMMLFLCILDTVYFIQNNMLSKDTGGAENFGIILPLFLISLLLIIRFI